MYDCESDRIASQVYNYTESMFNGYEKWKVREA